VNESKIARGLMLLGAGIGLASVVVWGLDVRVNVPDWMIRVAMIKLAFIASAGLLAGGALIGRHAKGRSLPAEDGDLLLREPGPSLEQGHAPKVPDEVSRPQRGTD
jgi:hypothetical protein